MGVSQAWISRKLTSARSLSVDKSLKIIEILDIGLAFLFPSKEKNSKKKQAF